MLKSFGGEIQVKSWPVDESERLKLAEQGYNLDKVIKLMIL
ncbi:hypothetical protein U0O82_02485 [Fervidobacterium thailandense]|nr:hypothetical protein [Fervidobacterium thailandense]